MDITKMSDGAMLSGDDIDANANRERVRQRRLRRKLYLLAPIFGYFAYRVATDNPIRIGIPGWLSGNPEIIIAVGLISVLGAAILVPMLSHGRSPHTVLRAEDSNVRLDDVVGADQTKREAIDSMNLFLASETFEQVMGGKPRRGVLFEGPPGTGKTYLAKAMAAEAGVPFHFVSASEFQSMYYGATNKKIRTFFKRLRKAAREEGGAIGYIEEFDAIGQARSGMGGNGMREGSAGIVNELLVQMQSFDMPAPSEKYKAQFVDWINKHLPPHRRIKHQRSPMANILIVAATNRASDLDAALLRPGRFDRTIGFTIPARSDRLEIAQYYLDRKTHTDEVTATLIADLSAGYTPVRIEKLLDEALIVALRQGRTSMNLSDVLSAQLITEVGVAQEMGYHPDERRRIAVHEAGHALTAILTRRDVKVASILRRSAALGLVSHGDAEERYLKTPTEARDLICVALAGRAAEQLEYGEASSGISSDLAYATNIACQLVGMLGNGPGLLSLEAAVMPTAGNLVAKVLADEPTREAAEAYMTEGAERADTMVARYRVALHEIADLLCAQDEVEGERIREIVARHADVDERRGPVRIKAQPSA